MTVVVEARNLRQVYRIRRGLLNLMPPKNVCWKAKGVRGHDLLLTIVFKRYVSSRRVVLA